jgi:hypothetical protein
MSDQSIFLKNKSGGFGPQKTNEITGGLAR